MASWSNLTVTILGAQKLAQASTNAELRFTRVVAGDGSLGDSELPESQTILKNQLVSVHPSSIKATDNKVEVTAPFGSQLSGLAFDLREIGVCARVGNESEFLMAYGNAGDNAEHIDATGNTSVERVFKLVFSFSSEATVSLTTDPQAYVTHTDWATYDAGGVVKIVYEDFAELGGGGDGTTEGTADCATVPTMNFLHEAFDSFLGGDYQNGNITTGAFTSNTVSTTSVTAQSIETQLLEAGSGIRADDFLSVGGDSNGVLIAAKPINKVIVNGDLDVSGSIVGNLLNGATWFHIRKDPTMLQQITVSSALWEITASTSSGTMNVTIKSTNNQTQRTLLLSPVSLAGGANFGARFLESSDPPTGSPFWHFDIQNVQSDYDFIFIII